MTKSEIELIAEEIASAINQGRFNESSRKFCDTCEDGILEAVESKTGRYDFRRFLNMVDQTRSETIQIKNEDV